MQWSGKQGHTAENTRTPTTPTARLFWHCRLAQLELVVISGGVLGRVPHGKTRSREWKHPNSPEQGVAND
jgi:hypothetical protein